ncbi:hypothetical protein AMECASPLE_033128 [Ameca splendens]|uniref:Uncharacterized protein n=1 Tax=Ameca splendens TaxID=208324 RepID=A0ABV0XW21_9TELE
MTEPVWLFGRDEGERFVQISESQHAAMLDFTPETTESSESNVDLITATASLKVRLTEDISHSPSCPAAAETATASVSSYFLSAGSGYLRKSFPVNNIPN